MGIEKFDDNDERYLTWIDRNPDGYVVNTPRRYDKTYFLIHKSTCRSINRNTAYKVGGFTERQYVKIVSLDVQEIMRYAFSKRYVGCKLCSLCDPFFEEANHFEIEVTDSVRLSAAERQRRLAKAPQQPGHRLTVIREFIRNPDVVAEVLYLAAGSCQSCGNRAPFRRTRDDSPFLEVHHKLPLAEGGLDTVENAIALCPNCHRREHFGQALHRP